MLYWYFRNIQCIIAALFKPKIKDPTTIVTKTFIANPFDSDWLSAISAGQFFTYTDSARWEIGVRTGFFKLALKHKWVVIMGGQKIIYRKPVKLFKRFQITMQFTGWDDKWLYAAHVFRQSEEVKCVSFSKIGFRCRGKMMSPIRIFELMGHSKPQPPPEWILAPFREDLQILEQASARLSL